MKFKKECFIVLVQVNYIRSTQLIQQYTINQIEEMLKEALDEKACPNDLMGCDNYETCLDCVVAALRRYMEDQYGDNN